MTAADHPLESHIARWQAAGLTKEEALLIAARRRAFGSASRPDQDALNAASDGSLLLKVSAPSCQLLLFTT